MVSDNQQDTRVDHPVEDKHVPPQEVTASLRGPKGNLGVISPIQLKGTGKKKHLLEAGHVN